MRCAFDHYLSQRGMKRVLRIGAIEAVVTIAPTGDQVGGLQFRQFVLYRLQ